MKFWPSRGMGANANSLWDELWASEGRESWRGSALHEVYKRIADIIPSGASVIDVGGGAGLLATELIKRGCNVTVWDHSKVALKLARAAGAKTRCVDLEGKIPEIPANTWVVATEVLEHLTEPARQRLLQACGKNKVCFSVPNNRLGPEEESQHTIQWTALEFRTYLREVLADSSVRVEVMGPAAEPHQEPAFLVGIRDGRPKVATLTVTLPVRDEAADLGRTLASFMGAADHIIVGVDPRTKDRTRDIVACYGESFELVDPEGPVPGKVYESPRMKAMSGEAQVPPGGVHFSWIRNQCLDKVQTDWVFMTEGHEPLVEGTDALLNLHTIGANINVVMVWRSDKLSRWGFPWLHRNLPEIAYERSTHNSLRYPDNWLVGQCRQIRTLHERDHSRSVARKDQRKIQNRITLMEDWLHRGSEYSKYYLASEMRDISPDRAEQHFKELLQLPSSHGPMRYQARLILAKLLMTRAAPHQEIKDVLLGCSSDDWSRTEHWVWLGDLARGQDRLEEAIQWYRLGAARIGNPPFTPWWIEMAYYSYLPAQRLAEALAEAGELKEAAEWGRRVIQQLPADAPSQMVDEAVSNVQAIEGASNG